MTNAMGPIRSSLLRIILSFALTFVTTFDFASAEEQLGVYSAEDATEEDREEIRRLEGVIRPGAWWVQTGLSGSLYDARREILFGRYTIDALGGYRFSKWGLFGITKFDRIVDFTQNTESISILNLGVGGEFLTFLGHVRSSVAFGLAILLEDTDIDQAGSRGWFVDIRPASLRWGLSDHLALEVTPLAFDVSVPVTTGIPLMIVSYLTVVNLEWSFL